MSRQTIQDGFNHIAAQTQKNSISPEMVATAMSDHLAETVLQDDLTAATEPIRQDVAALQSAVQTLNTGKAPAEHTHLSADITDRHAASGHSGYIENSDTLMSMSEFWRIFKRCILAGNNVYLQHSTADGDADDNIHYDYIPGLRSLSDRINQKADANHNHDTDYAAIDHNHDSAYVSPSQMQTAFADAEAQITAAMQAALEGKISTGGLKTINNQSLEGTGNIVIEGGSGSEPHYIQLEGYTYYAPDDPDHENPLPGIRRTDGGTPIEDLTPGFYYGIGVDHIADSPTNGSTTPGFLLHHEIPVNLEGTTFTVKLQYISYIAPDIDDPLSSANIIILVRAYSPFNNSWLPWELLMNSPTASLANIGNIAATVRDNSASISNHESRILTLESNPSGTYAGSSIWDTITALEDRIAALETNSEP